MTLQWSFIAVFLYGEIGLITILLLPFISASRWQKIFRSSIIQKFAKFSHIYFNVFIVILLLLFMDAIREVRKYAGPTSEVDLKHNPDQENLAHMRLFRAQRNLYIAGFALFGWFIIRRLVTLLSLQAQMQAQSEASQKQAQSASDAAKKLMEEKDNIKNMARSDDTDVDAIKREKDLATQLDETKLELKKLKKELEMKQTDFEALKKQSEGTNKEYDRLLNEYSKAQEKLESPEDGSKKSN
ncbi:B-cell receptor-associated protein 31-like [Mya arenaria]|uniref:B-cell receptor-associated protein 31-like n=1 Tax=Mya arenaria TaxID=6604 RepID=UPI0022DF81F2|nr:B-cell receptor-associated protein 31-like [Mya arenaria]